MGRDILYHTLFILPVNSGVKGIKLLDMTLVFKMKSGYPKSQF